MARPVIGISTYREAADWGSWRRVPADLLPGRYADAIRAGGGIPVLLPPAPDPDDAAAVLDRLDGVLIAGGADVDPARYHQDPGPHSIGFRPDRDASELALLDAAAARDLPTLGICRGMQMMAVHAEGTLLQHVPDALGSDRHAVGPGVYGPIAVRTVPGTAVAELLGAQLTVPCHHHQAVADHPGMVPAAHAEDGTLEAMEDPDHRFWVGVQWHPETGTDMRLFAALAAACGR
jgi:putative glutamine amidotransferase